jgi:alkanesulfonate monooxygenase SsuD/methylene tetrahydromethanopterin reductase-like flavin-dependent oxidoreductase (luciferase family)
MVAWNLGFDMRSPDFATPTAKLYAAALEMAAYADAHGVDEISVQEHHQSEDGYLPAPFVLAGALAARTQRTDILLAVVLLPLHDPVKLAEQIAVLDLVSGGRLKVAFGAGYVPNEFAAFGVDIHSRGRLMDEGLEIIQRALAGERFEFGGREVFVRPLPVQRPVRMFVGGGVPASARRAARFDMGLYPLKPEIVPLYEQECARLGRAPREVIGAAGGWAHIAEDPEADWVRLKPYVDHVARSYSAWGQDPASSSSPFKTLDTAEALRASGFLRVLTPDECVEEAKAGRGLGLVPLIGGCPPELGWRSLELMATKVLPRLKAAQAGG